MGGIFRGLKGSRGQLFKKYGLGRPQAFIFFMLAHSKDGTAVKDLAAKAHVTSGAITQLLDPLVDQGLLERFEDKQDRRVVRVKLTTKAHTEVKDLRQTQFEEIVHIFDELSDAEINQLVGLLKKVKVDDIDGHCAMPGHHHDAKADS
jgi:DNA-binding MarR family transcriptional regulator